MLFRVESSRFDFMLLRRMILACLLCSSGVAAEQPQKGSPARSLNGGGTVKRAWSQGVLGEQTARLEKARRKVGDVRRRRPRMLEQGQVLPVWLAPPSLAPETPGCVTVSVLSAPNVAFLLVFDDSALEPSRRAWPVPSAAGVAEVTRCGARKPLLATLGAKMRSRRGVLELLVTASSHPPPGAIETLTERNAGAMLSSPHVGKRPRLGPLELRVRRQTERWRRSGAAQVVRTSEDVGQDGRGDVVLHLEPGCHELRVLGESNRESPLDIDSRLYSVVTDEVLDADEEHSGQSKIVHCVGRGARFRLDFMGARPGSEVSVLHARWELPEGLPLSWGPHARAQLARAMFTDGFTSIDSPPLSSSLGVRGSTSMRVEVDSRACYLAAVAPIRGDAQRFALGAYVGGRLLESQGAESGRGASVEFCALGADVVELETSAGGSGLAWILGLWEIGATDSEGRIY